MRSPQPLLQANSVFGQCEKICINCQSQEKGFHILEKRWIIERTFAWLLMNRRLTCDYEKHASSSETLIRLAMIRLMLKRLHPS